MEIPEFVKKVSFLASRPQCVQRDESVYLFFKKWEHLGMGVVSIPLEGLNRALYLSRDAMEQAHQKVIENISTEQSFDEHLKGYKKLMAEYQEAILFFGAADSDKKHLREALDLFIELSEKLSDYVLIPFVIDKSFDLLFQERLRKESGDQYRFLQEGISSPTQFHEYQNMRLAMCEYVISGSDSHRAASELAEKFAWYGEYSYLEKLYDENYFFEELSKLTQESAVIEKEKLFDGLKISIQRFENTLSAIGDPLTRLYAKIINQYIFLRTDRIDSFKKLQTAFRNVFSQIAAILSQETGETWGMAEVVSMTNDELAQYLDGTFMPDKKEMTQRATQYVYYRNAQTTTVLTKKEEMDVLINMVLSSVEHCQTIKGMVAYKGKVQGRVALVFSKEDLHKVVDGSVLVARTTMVDYISAMEKAVAVVTEEGGITSHAAIIARELKKPCIVGTGNCTRILKDGDIIEVDADSGVVKII